MLPSSSTVSLVQNYLRTQQGVVEVAKPETGQLLLTVGERVQATVTDQLPNGRFAVLIKDQLLDLNLPRNTQPGEQLDLTVISKEPKLTFALTSTLQDSGNTGQQTGVALSQAGKLLNTLLSQTDSSPQAATLKQSLPLFEGMPKPEELANQLSSRLADSGLFYESHQAEWVNGNRSLQSLLREPQAKQSNNELQLHGQDRNSSHIAASNPSTQETGKPASTGSLSSLSVQQAELLNTDQGLRQLVQQQLKLVENHPLVWQGQAWPGQDLSWKLELENETGPADVEAETTHVWKTHLNLDLPRMGQLGVVASLRNGQFSLQFEAGKAETVAALQQNQNLLLNRFSAAGLSLVSSLVCQHVEENDT